MARGIEMNGQLRGKRGGVVYYRAEGQQVSRARNFSPKNPRSRAQMLQRLMLANASKAAVGMKEIIDHSFEGIPYGPKSVRHFESKAQLALKAATPSVVEPLLVTPCVPLDALGFPVAKFMVSSGTLKSADYNLIQEAASGQIEGFAAQAKSDFASLAAMKVSDIFAALGLEIGQQITIISTVSEEGVGGAGTQKIFNDNVWEAPIRLNFLASASDELAFDQQGRLKSAVIDTEKSNAWDQLVFTVDNGVLKASLPFESSGFALIVSVYENGAWRRSTEFLSIAAGSGEDPVEDNLYQWGWNNYNDVMETLVKGDNPVEEYFLNKEDN